jgi:hypothetical protein
MSRTGRLIFDCSPLQKLAFDSVSSKEPKSTPGVIYSAGEPTPLSHPVMLLTSPSALSLLGPEAVNLTVDELVGNTFLVINPQSDRAACLLAPLHVVIVTVDTSSAHSQGSSAMDVP